MQIVSLPPATLLLALSASVALSDVPVQAPSGRYVSDPAHTSVVWRIGHMGLSNYTARFADVSISLDFDAGDFARSTVTARVDPASVRTDYPGADKDFDAEVAFEPAILNARAHPVATFRSTAVTMTGPTTADVEGDLTLLGVTRPVTLEVTYNGSMAEHPFLKVPALGFSARTTISRAAFGNDFLTGVALADEVELLIETELLRL